MNRRIAKAVLGFLIVLGALADLQAQETARLRVQVTVVPAVTTVAVPVTISSLSISSGAELNWAPKQQNHVVSQNVSSAELASQWNQPSNACDRQGTKVLSGSFDKGSCEIILNTVEFISE